MDVMSLKAVLELDSKLFEKGLKTAKAGLVAFGGMITAAGAAVAKVTTQAVAAYASYEQLVGGVETLFKGSANAVITNAENAYKTAGMSANEYMETVTGFSASLLQSLGGNTEKAVEYADKAVRDMSDNANKMGTDISSIQAAYQGFAKQNYTMLDNLKLGYGGTKEEMQRLLADAEKLTGQKFDISNYADIVEAIHAVQTEMGITGTTALEAEKTIEGSTKAMKASWQNLLVAFGSGKNVKDAMKKFTASTKTMVKNIIPVVKNALNGIGEFVGELGPVIVQELPGLIQDVLPDLLAAAGNLVAAIARALPGILSAIITSVKTALSDLSTWVGGDGASIKESILQGLSGIGQLIYDLLSDVPELLKTIDWYQLGVDITNFIINGLAELASGFGEEGKNAEGEIRAIDWVRLGLDIATAILDGIGMIGQGIYDTISNGIKEAMGLEPDLRKPWEKAKDAILTEWGTLPYDAKRNAVRVVKAYKEQFDPGTWAQIVSVVGDELAEKTETGVNTAIRSVGKLQSAINNLKGKNITITIDTKGGANVGGSPKITPNARAMIGGYIFDRPTIFGYADGSYQMAGEAGPEAVVGVRSLDSMIQSSVSNAVASVVGRLDRIINGQNRDMKVVLDSGILVGEIAAGMDTQLGQRSEYSARGNA